MFPTFVPRITMFQSVLAVCGNDIVRKGLSSGTGRPAPVRLSRSCSNMLKYFPLCVDA